MLRYGVAGILICLVTLAILVFFMRLNSGDGGAYDKERNFNYSDNRNVHIHRQK